MNDQPEYLSNEEIEKIILELIMSARYPWWQPTHPISNTSKETQEL